MSLFVVVLFPTDASVFLGPGKVQGDKNQKYVMWEGVEGLESQSSTAFPLFLLLQESGRGTRRGRVKLLL